MILPFFIGTYTSPGGSEGIYQSTLNLETGELRTPILAAKTQNPSYLALSPDGKTLACVNELSNGTLTFFDLKANALENPSTVPLRGNGPCHLSFSSDGSQIYVASYGSGHFEAFSWPPKPLWALDNRTAKLSGQSDEGEGPFPAHAHCIKSDLKNQYVFATDLGRNQFLIFSKGKIVNAVHLPSPRHFVINPRDNSIYTNSEHDSSVTQYFINYTSGTFLPGGTRSTLPPNTTVKNTTAEILIHPNGKFIYVSNRGHNSIATIPLDEYGRMGDAVVTQIEAQIPRGLAIDPTGTYLLAAGQANDIIISLKINQKTGLPSPTGNKISLSKPVHMLFVQPKG